MSRRALGLSLVALVALAVAIAGAGTSADAAPMPVTLGSTAGTPTMNVCLAGIDCTYASFSGVSVPALGVPVDGTVTSFSLNSGSGSGAVALRVLRPAAGGQFTGAGTSPMETLNSGLNTYTVSLPVKAGDVLGIDNSTSALLFDTSNQNAITAYFELPSLTDGTTTAPDHDQSDLRLLLSAVVQPSTPPAVTPPVISGVSETKASWRAGGNRGTTFAFSLNEAATVKLSFSRQLSGRTKSGRCVAQTSHNRRAAPCTFAVASGSLSLSGHAGANKVSFHGRVSGSRPLKPGSYTIVISAVNSSGSSNTAALAFAITR